MTIGQVPIIMKQLMKNNFPATRISRFTNGNKIIYSIVLHNPNLHLVLFFILEKDLSF